MADDILKELLKLESLSKASSSSASSSKGKSKPLQTTVSDLESALEIAENQIKDGIDVENVVKSLIKEAEGKKVDVEKGLKEWYGGLSKVGKAIDKSEVAAISNTYDVPSPPLFSSEESRRAMDGVILETMVRKGAWDAAETLCRETGISFNQEMRRLSEELHATIDDMNRGDVESALKWTSKHHDFLSAPPHPSPLMFYLHRARLIQLLLDPSVSSTTANPHNDCPAPLQYARDHLYPYIVSSHQQEIYHLLGALLYTPSQLPTSPYADLLSPSLQPPALVPLFKVEFCRLHGWAREDPLSVAVDLGAGGALGKIDKARKVMKDRLGEVRTWEELPVSMELPVPLSRRYHSVFACPVSKEQATDSNPPKMLSCGHTIAQDSLTKLSKHGRRAVKCPYCPQETAIASAMRLYL
ncbi:hypothetical protein FFLO_07105 [Filobasidium floriforme]|uniref:GID complex catalytic subunit 2 n=1 Tax=Filobasidium floriforme TaxID=5210 RepID=A0A8K0JDJ7_9TREE|nr:hypothetical protein FFLO_07105 [Filobasidium floriforme]